MSRILILYVALLTFSSLLRSESPLSFNASLQTSRLEGKAAARLEGESFQDALARHEKAASRLLGALRDRVTPMNMRTGVDQLNLSKVPAWSQEQIRAHFIHSRDLRFIHKDGQVRFPPLTPDENALVFRRISWLFPDEGCFARAELVKALAKERSLPLPYKLYAFGSLEVKTDNHPEGVTRWWFHVAPVIRSKKNGELYVMDAAVEARHPLPWKKWLLRQVRSLDDVEVALGDHNAYHPFYLAFGGSDRLEEALDDQGVLLPYEWNRQLELGRDPLHVLGDFPPWVTLLNK